MHDLGSAFTSGLWKAVMKAFDIKDVKTTPKFSQANGKAESMNRRLNQCFRVTLNDSNWKNYDIYVKYIVFCLNSLACTRTGMTPNFLVYGRELRMPRDLFVECTDRIDQMLINDADQDYQVKKSAYDLYKNVSRCTRIARDNSQRRAKYMAKQYDKRVRGPYFKVGDWCFLLELWPKHKYADTWKGPYRVVKVLNDHNYVVDTNGKEKVVSISKMKPYRLNKHSESASEPDKIAISESRQPLRQKKRREDDSSDEDSIIITWDVPTQRRSRRIAEKRQMSEKTSPLSSSGAATSMEDDDKIASDIDPAGTLHNTEGDQESALRATGSETSFMSDQEFVDAQEILNEADPDQREQSSAREASVTNRSSPTEQPAEGSGRLNTSGPSGSQSRFGEIDTPISLKDITEQEKIKRGKKSSTDPKPGTTRSGLSFRGRSPANKASAVATSSDNTDQGGSRAPYNLRSKSKPGNTALQIPKARKADSGKERKIKPKK
jgi:hypothetical protein